MVFGVWDVGLRVWGLGLEVEGLRLRGSPPESPRLSESLWVRGWGLGIRGWGWGLEVEG